MIEKIKEILKLPKEKIEIINHYEVENEISKMYKNFTKRHPKYKIFKNKTLGVMLYKLPKTIEEYEKKIAGKNGVEYFSRRCRKMGYDTRIF